jgi:hypothetical protein
MQDRILIATNKYLQNVAKLKCLEMTVTNQSCIHKEIVSRLSLENPCCHLIQNLLSSHLLSKKLKVNFTSCFV